MNNRENCRVKKTALFPGSFDPFTDGHEALVRRALELFDRVVIAVGINSDKQYMFSSEERVSMIEKRFDGEERIKVVSYSDMTVDCCRREDAGFILRGVRNTKDFEYEQTVAAVNRKLAPDIDTVILFSDLEYKDVSSTIEREKLRIAGRTAGRS